MVQKSYPSTDPITGRGLAEYQQMGLASGPEGILYGGGLSYVGARVARLGAVPVAKSGGFSWSSDQPIDIESTPNTNTSFDRIDRLVLQLDPATGKNTPVVLAGVPAATPPVPALTQNRIGVGSGSANGLWQTPIGRWTVGRNGGPISNLVYESSYPTRQEVPVAGESGAGITNGSSIHISTMSITPFHPRCEIWCETSVYLRTLDAAAGSITIRGGGKDRSENFKSDRADDSVTVKLLHTFYNDGPQPIPLIVIASAEPNSATYVVGRIITLIRERAV